jgi:hypothetical protein
MKAEVTMVDCKESMCKPQSMQYLKRNCQSSFLEFSLIFGDELIESNATLDFSIEIVVPVISHVKQSEQKSHLELQSIAAPG